MFSLRIGQDAHLFHFMTHFHMLSNHSFFMFSNPTHPFVIQIFSSGIMKRKKRAERDTQDIRVLEKLLIDKNINAETMKPLVRRM